MRRTILLAVLTLLSTGMVYAGAQSEQGAGASVVVNPPGTMPIVDELITIDVMTLYGAVESDGNYQGAEFTAWYEDLTNVRMNFVDIVESQSWSERLNLVLASGDLPDTIMNQHAFSSGQTVFQNGIFGNFIPVDDLIEDWMPGLAATLEEYPQYAAQLVMPDGKRYSFPSLEATCYHCMMSYKMWIYEPWLEALGIDRPETTDEFYEMLVAFRDDDPNGTGRADTIPLVGAASGAWNAGPLMPFILNSFIYTDPASFLKRTGNDVQFVANTTEWREGVRYVARLYREGLLLPDSFTQDATQLRSAVENPGPALVGAVPAGWYGVFSINSWEGSGRFADFHMLSPLQGPTGLRQTTFMPPAVQHHTVITRDARHPEVIARLNDWFYESLENREIGQNFAFAGVDYRWLTADERASGELVSTDFSIADFVLLREQTYGEDRSWAGWRRLAPRFAPGGGNAMPPEWRTDPTKQGWRNAQGTREYYEPFKADHSLPPGLIVADDLQDELTDLRQLLIGAAGAPGLVQQFYAEFVTGSRDINNDAQWRAYVNELNRAGVDRYVEIIRGTLAAAGR